MTTLRADIYSADGVQLSVLPLAGTDIESFTYSPALNKIATFQLRAAAGCKAAANATEGRQLWVYRGSTLLFKGYVEQADIVIDTDGKATLEISGRSIAAALTWKSTLAGRMFSDQTLATVVSTLLTGTDFTAGEQDVPLTNISTRFDGRSIWDALVFVADVFGLLLREDYRDQEIDIGAFGTDTGITLRNVASISPVSTNPYFVPISSIKRRSFALDIVTKLTPLGQTTGIAGSTTKFTLGPSTRTSPYTIQTETNPDASTAYYIEDAAATAAYGTRERTIEITGIIPLGGTTAQAVLGANSLYDSAVTFLQRHSAPLQAYEVEVAGLTDIEGAVRFRPGDAFHLQYEGAIEDVDGRRIFLNVDTTLYLMGYQRSLGSDGSDTCRLTLSNITREMPNDGNITERFMASLEAVKGVPMPYVIFGDNVSRFSGLGLQMNVGESLIDIDTANAVSFTSSDFQTTYSRMFGVRNSTIDQGQIRDVLAEGSDDGFFLDVIWGTNYDGGDSVYEDLVKMGGTRFTNNSMIKSVYVDATPVGGLKQISASPEKWAWVALNGGSLKVVGGMDMLVKEADETVNNSAALQNDNELSIAIGTADNIQFEGVLFLSGATSTADFKFAFTGPAGCTGAYSGIGQGAPGVTPADSASLGGEVNLDSASGNIFFVRYWGSAAAQGTSGTLQLQWAQNTPTVIDTKVLAGSYIKWQVQ